ncbi:claudin-15-like [Sceloporus undulatus]|uniref:claudin-15-like n=1 Tax=Sceloporus undulatus TaxID=8520 RepID=UPI001C4D3A69|nr:claudin-15-like [Sceloporus undulatus]
MTSTAIQISALVLAFLGLTLLHAATVSNTWKYSSTSTEIITASWINEGLWKSCVATSFGSVQCKTFSSLLNLETYIQVCRALMITSLILGMCGTLFTLLGLKCTQLGSNSENTKAKITMTGGTIFILGGLSSIIAISWYAARITAQFFDSFYGGTKFELGYALYLGWAGSLLSMLGGVFLTCSACRGKHRNQRYDYSAAKRTNESRIYIKKSETVTPVQDYV